MNNRIGDCHCWEKNEEKVDDEKKNENTHGYSVMMWNDRRMGRED